MPLSSPEKVDKAINACILVAELTVDALDKAFDPAARAYLDSPNTFRKSFASHVEAIDSDLDGILDLTRKLARKAVEIADSSLITEDEARLATRQVNEEYCTSQSGGNSMLGRWCDFT